MVARGALYREYALAPVRDTTGARRGWIELTVDDPSGPMAYLPAIDYTRAQATVLTGAGACRSSAHGLRGGTASGPEVVRCAL